MTDERRLPLPSGDAGDLADDPLTGQGSDDDATLEGDDAIQASAPFPRAEALEADLLAALRASGVPAGERVRIAVQRSTVLVRGEVESLDVSDELLGLIGDVAGVDEVVDELEVSGI